MILILKVAHLLFICFSNPETKQFSGRRIFVWHVLIQPLKSPAKITEYHFQYRRKGVSPGNWQCGLSKGDKTNSI